MPLARVRRIIGAAMLTAPPIPEALGTIQLRRRQRELAARLVEAIERDGGALLAEPVGLGKTYTALAVAARFGTDVVIVAPASLREMWRTALHDCAIAGDVVTHEALSRGAVLRDSATMIVVDEAHRFRNSSAKRYARLADACRRSRLLLVTATPVQNRRSDLAAQLALFVGRRAWSMTVEQLATYVVRGAGEHDEERRGLPARRGPIVLPLDLDDDCLDRILALPSPVPARDESIAEALLVYGLVHQWTSSRAALVGALRRRRTRGLAMLDAVAAGRSPTRAELSAWTHAGDAMQLAFPELVTAAPASPDADLDSLATAIDRHVAGIDALLRHCRSSRDPDVERANALARVRRDHPGERVIAFCHYGETVAGLHRLLASSGGVAALTARGAVVAGGRVPRGTIVSQFEPRAIERVVSPADRVDLLLTTDLLSEGVNLQEASVVVHLDLPWNPARLEQRVGRVRRLGSRHDVVTVYSLAPPASSERLLRIEARLRDKLRIAERAIGVAGSILPSPLRQPPSDIGLAELTANLQARLRRWSTVADRATLPSDVAIGAVQSAAPGFLALVRDGAEVRLFTSSNGRITDDQRDVERAMDVAEGIEAAPDPVVVSQTLARLATYADERRGTTAIDLTIAAAARGRRKALERVSRAMAGVPRHRRAELAPLADAARNVALAQLGEGAERVLDMLVRSELPNDAWLRAVAAFGEVNVRPTPRPGESPAPAVIALIVFQPPAL